jgi:hypothetical protein
MARNLKELVNSVEQKDINNVLIAGIMTRIRTNVQRGINLLKKERNQKETLRMLQHPKRQKLVILRLLQIQQLEEKEKQPTTLVTKIDRFRCKFLVWEAIFKPRGLYLRAKTGNLHLKRSIFVTSVL